MVVTLQEPIPAAEGDRRKLHFQGVDGKSAKVRILLVTNDLQGRKGKDNMPDLTGFPAKEAVEGIHGEKEKKGRNFSGTGRRSASGMNSIR